MKKLITIFALCLLLTGCGDKENTEEAEKVVNNTTSNTTEEVKKDVEKIELYSDDTKIVFKQVNGSYLVFYYEGDSITGYETYLDYEDTTTASVAYTVLKADHSAYENVEEILQKGQYVIIKFNNDAYSGYTLEEVKLTYSALEQIQKNN